MNRLIIIGNGFDLAHGLKTGYEDFLIDYFKQLALETSKIAKINSKNPLVDCFVRSGTTAEQIHEIFKENNTIHSLLNKGDIFFSRTDENWDMAINHYPNTISYRIKNAFFNGLLENRNWTDIEYYYFAKLLEIFKGDGNPGVVNGPFEILSLEVFDYLKTQNSYSKSVVNDKFQTFIDSLFKGFGSTEKFEMLFVNFNYTGLLNNYINFDHQEEHNFIHIHGVLSDPESIIFGYGDDSHKKYSELEDTLNDDYLKHIKSHRYNSDATYDTLTGFLEKGKFEVFVVGHSLGVSDRVLLKTIFEHEDCEQIRLYHRGKDSHFKKRIALSRHFTDKIKLRERIVSFDPNHRFI